MKVFSLLLTLLLAGCSTTRKAPSIPEGWRDYVVHFSNIARETIQEVDGYAPKGNLPNLLFVPGRPDANIGTGYVVIGGSGSAPLDFDGAGAYWAGKTLHIPGPAPLPGTPQHAAVLRLIHHEMMHHYGILGHPARYRQHVPLWRER